MAEDTQQQVNQMIDLAHEYKRERDVALAEVKRLRAILALAAELAVEGGSTGLRELADQGL